jgi:osmoprotectant transport system permease protein
VDAQAGGAVTHFFGEVYGWFTTSAHWHGTDGIPHRMWEHSVMSIAAVAFALAIALPLGVWFGHRRRGGMVLMNVSNVGRALPSLAVLGLGQEALGLRGWPGFGARPAFIALLVLAIPPIVTNAYTGVSEVDPDIRESALGMGMTGAQVLRRVELPLALPLVMAGVRTSAVQVVATATLAAELSWGGLGRYIIDGIGRQDNVMVFAGALQVGVLALVTEVLLAAVQRRVVPKGLQSGENVPSATPVDARPR